MAIQNTKLETFQNRFTELKQAHDTATHQTGKTSGLEVATLAARALADAYGTKNPAEVQQLVATDMAQSPGATALAKLGGPEGALQQGLSLYKHAQEVKGDLTARKTAVLEGVKLDPNFRPTAADIARSAGILAGMAGIVEKASFLAADDYVVGQVGNRVHLDSQDGAAQKDFKAATSVDARNFLVFSDVAVQSGIDWLVAEIKDKNDAAVREGIIALGLAGRESVKVGADASPEAYLGAIGDRSKQYEMPKAISADQVTERDLQTLAFVVRAFEGVRGAEGPAVAEKFGQLTPELRNVAGHIHDQWSFRKAPEDLAHDVSKFVDMNTLMAGPHAGEVVWDLHGPSWAAMYAVPELQQKSAS